MATQLQTADSQSAPEVQPRWVEPLTLLLPAGLWLGLLLLIPTLLIFELSLVPGIRPGQVVNPSGLDNYCRILGFDQCGWLFQGQWDKFDSINLQVVARSLLFAIGTTIVCLLLGFPVAYWIALMVPKRWQNLVLVAFVLPLWTSSLLRSYAWITILRPTGVLNTLLTSLGLPPLDILNRPAAVLLGMSYGLLPYMVLILYASLEKLDRRLLEA
ncbi:MAG TPA: ABC transporter permease, partial [Thermosynechococcaceae cyanobacterium]